MKLGIFAKTFAGSNPAKVLNAVKAAGFSCTQYNMACSGLEAMPQEISSSAATAVAHASQSTGIQIAAVSGTYNMIHPDNRVRIAGHARLETLAAACSAMGTNLITLCTGTRDPDDQWRDHKDNNTPEAWADLVSSMETALGIADQYNITLGIEPELANVVNSAAKAKQLIASMQSPRLKIVFDAANLFEVASLENQRRIISQSLELLAPHIVMAHAKDRNADGSFATAGKGVIDFTHYLKTLRALDFKGPLVTHGLKAEEAQEVAQFLKEKLSG